jgi:hypothetical protein
MTSTAQRLLETARTLPEPLLAQVLDFAEYLRARQAGAPAGPDRVPLAALCGGLDDSATFAGSPTAIQERLRDEWH